MKKITYIATILILLLTGVTACKRVPDPKLHNHTGMLFGWPVIDLNLDIYWNYTEDYGWDYEWQYDWRKEWFYGWDADDVSLWGEIGYADPTHFQIRRYYTGDETLIPHPYAARPEDVEGRHFFAKDYEYGYYDILVWNDVETLDGIVSLNIDESISLDSVIAYTNPTRRIVKRSPTSNKVMYAHWQPEGLVADYKQSIFISRNPEDYDWYDPVEHLYHKDIDMLLYPVTYIYLVQLILHHNGGRIDNVVGEADATGLARTTCLNTGIAGPDPVAVYFETRMKYHMDKLGEDVDIAGGRFVTFGLCGLNPNWVTRRANVEGPLQVEEMDRIISAQDIAEADPQVHYLDIPVIFYNGMDTVLTFDVTDQVRKLYRGGVLTVELDVDTVPVPGRRSGNLFDVLVVERDSAEFEFQI